jgi:hypothetical protein
MWSAVNSTINAIFDVLLWPAQGLSAGWQVFLIALPATVVALLAFRFTSNQAGITRAKNLIKARLLELRLFKDDARVLLRAQGSILRHSFSYMRHGLTPMLVMLVPFLLILIQVESRFAFAPLPPGEPSLLSVEVDSADLVSSVPASLALPDGLVAETPPLRIDASSEIYWRIRGNEPGRYAVRISVDGETVIKHVVVGHGGRVSPTVYRADDWRVLAWPAEPSIAGKSSVRAIHLDYPRSRAEFAGLSSASWLLFGWCIVLGFLLRGFFGVTF